MFWSKYVWLLIVSSMCYYGLDGVAKTIITIHELYSTDYYSLQYNYILLSYPIFIILWNQVRKWWINFVYENGFPNANPTSVTCGNGDGSITLDSSRICLQWAGSNVSFTSRTFQGTTHVGMVSNKTVLEALAEIVGAPINLDRNLRSSANTTNASGLLATINCLFIVLLAFNFLI